MDFFQLQDEEATLEIEFIVLEIFLKTVPSIIFLVASVFRFHSIRSVGFSRTVVYSTMLKWKIAFSFMMSLTWFVLLILVFAEPKSFVTHNWFSGNGKEYWSLFYLFNVAAWFVCPLLLVYEYRKRLPEAWYTHKFFWSVNLIINLIALIILFDVYVSFFLLQGWVNVIFNFMAFFINLILII